MEPSVNYADHANLNERISSWNLNLPAHPETPFETDEIAFFIADTLRSAGIETFHHSPRDSRVIGVIHGAIDGPWISLTAHADPLDFLDPSTAPFIRWRGDTPVERTAHSIDLLAVATHLARTRDFAGTVVVVFRLKDDDIRHPGIQDANDPLGRMPIACSFGIPGPEQTPGTAYWIETVRSFLGSP